MTFLKNNIRTVGVGLLILAAGWYLLSGSDASSGAPVSELAGPGSVAETTFVELAARLGSIDFDTTIFSNERFSALKDIRTEIVPEASGRVDPFAPLSGQGAAR